MEQPTSASKQGRKRIERIAEWSLNVIAVAFVAYIVTSSVATHFGEKGAKPAPAAVLKIGDTIDLPDAQWQRSPRTLILALSANCRYCTESAPFYRALLDRAGSGQWRMMAVLPQPADVATAYMRSGGYEAPEVRQVELANIGVTRTPTLLLVNDRGELQQQWIGLLSPADEADVARHLGTKEWTPDASRSAENMPETLAGSSDSPLVRADELRPWAEGKDRVNLLDVRERERYARGRVKDAMNIPVDELAVRAPHELWLDAPTVVYCRFQPACADLGIPSLCSQAVNELQRIGIKNVRVIRDSLTSLAQAGVTIEGASDER